MYGQKRVGERQIQEARTDRLLEAKENHELMVFESDETACVVDEVTLSTKTSKSNGSRPSPVWG
eukprot:CAMPEP_0114557346 /NCGR_PEP_ID=MMETSP0114-20121206/9782_1 /TAXON_ID=31324 /ORGANISM="Goniomonas sp, Strain m" /LENGTH=63 /DNA_ID=CAMNT_0001742629 /DNA_START=186 /DNA_END=380 /DNA_ORIENTATION=+